MATADEKQQFLDRIAEFRAHLIADAPLLGNSELAEAFKQEIDALVASYEADLRTIPPPPGGGFLEFAGYGASAVGSIGSAYVPPPVDSYDDTVTSERLGAIGDLYYIFNHEKVGVFTVVLKLAELFRSGSVKLSDGPGATLLYQYDKKHFLRYTRKDRAQAYSRVFGYTKAVPPKGSKPNTTFHRLFITFMKQVAQFFRDKRVSNLLQPGGPDPSFGSIAIVRRTALDLRNNLKSASYGHIMPLRIEVQQLLNEAFRVLNSNDVKQLFGAENAWDVIEEVSTRYLGRPQISASQRSRMATAGRDVLNWLSQSDVLDETRTTFEAKLLTIGEDAEEWVTSAASVGVSRPISRPATRKNGKVAVARKQSRELEGLLEFD